MISLDKAKQFISYKKDIIYLDILKKQNDVDEATSDILKSDKKIVDINQSIQNVEYEIEGLDWDLKRINEEIDSFENKGEFRGIKEKTDRLHGFEKEKTRLEEKIEDIENDLRFEQELMPRLGMHYDFLKDTRLGNIVLLNKHIKEYISELKLVEKNLEIEIGNLDREKKLSEKNKCEIVKKQELLSQGKNNYDSKVTDLIEIIKNSLKEKCGKEVPVLPLCECVEIVEKEWADAIEGILDVQRFDLILPPEYFYDTVEIYEEKFRNKNLYEIGIVNTGAKREDRILDNSLYTKIKVLNPYADNICKNLLGRIVCVNSIEDFKPYQSCITMSCIKYDNDTVRAINPKVYEMPYVGENSLQKRKQILVGLAQEEEDKLANIHRNLKELDNKKRLIQASKLIRKHYEEVENYWAQLKRLEIDIENLDKEIQEVTKAVDMVSLTNKYDALKKQQLAFSAQQLCLQNKKKELNRTSVQEQIIKGNNETKLENAKQQYENAYSVLLDKEELANFKRNIEATGSELAIEIAKKRQMIERIQEAVKKGMKEYVKCYNANLSAEIECVNDFIAEYNKIKDWGFVLSEAAADEAFKTAQKSFNENFVSKLRYKFECVKRELDRINNNLKIHPFGRDGEIFEFTFQASGEQEMQDYVRIINSGKDITQKDLFTETLDSKDLSIMQGLFEKLAKIGNPSQHEKDLDKYLDYRCYFRYDIVIINRNKERIPFSKTYRKRSGGEMQTPFYVILGACFDQLIKRDEFISSACLVAFDEAFNNMDESRILTLMKYYKKLNIQLIIVVPTNHSKEIIPCVDTTVSLKKENNYIYETYLINE